MALPYAAFPKYGPSVLGQAKYDAELRKWELYQASLRNPGADPSPDVEMPEVPVNGDDLDTFTYLRKYVKVGQTRKRIFREQNIKAIDADHALRQGRDAMDAELGPRRNEDQSYNWVPVPGSEKAVKPRGKPMQSGDDDRRNEEGTNGGDARPDAMPSEEVPEVQQQQQSGGGEGGDQSAEGEGGGGTGESEDGQDDSPRMPTCPECGKTRGNTPGCCAPESQDMEMPEMPEGAPEADLQLLRTDGQAPLVGADANDRIEDVAKGNLIATLTKSLGDVDKWSRALVKHDVQVLATELYEAMQKSHIGLVEKMSKIRGGSASLKPKQVEDIVKRIVDSALAQFDVPEPETPDYGKIANLVGDLLNAPRRIEVSMNGKVQEIEGTPHGAFDESLRAMTRGLDLFMVGPAGSGKGFLAKHLSEALGQRFGFLSCSEGMSEGMLLGRGVPLADRFLYLQSSFVDFYENGGVFLLDEIDAANPNVLLIINECLSSPHLSIPNRVDNPYAVRHKHFYCIVAANTWGTGPDMEYVGRNRLDAAFLNRFIGSQIELNYDARIEGTIAKAYMGPKEAEDVLKRFWGVRKKLEELSIRRIWSTRGLEKMCIALSAGDDMATVLDAHTRGWTRDEKSKAGVSA